MCEYKPPTVTNEEWDIFEQDILAIRECKTLQDLKLIKCKLKEEYNQIEEFKKHSKDVSELLENFSLKLEMVEQVNFELEQKFILDQRIQTENKLAKKNQFAVDKLFDELVNCEIDLLIMFDFQLSTCPYNIINCIKRFLDSAMCRRIRAALLWPVETNYYMIDFFDNQTETENFILERIDKIFDKVLERFKWNEKSFRSYLIFHIWNLDENFLSTISFKNNQERFFFSRVNLLDDFDHFYSDKLNENSLKKILDEIRMKKLVYDLFFLKRNGIWNSGKFIKSSGFQKNMKFSLVEDLKGNIRSHSKINLKINSFELIGPNKIFKAERKFFFCKKEEMWLELFPNMKTNIHFYNIYTKTLYFIESFNNLYNQIEISICKTNFLYDQTCKHWLCNKLEDNLEKKEINSDFFKNDICQAFMHFCYFTSNTELIIFDLGPKFKNKNSVLFTEPVIQTKCFDTEKYSRANLGTNGIEFFFENKHNCNILCKKFIK